MLPPPTNLAPHFLHSRPVAAIQMRRSLALVKTAVDSLGEKFEAHDIERESPVQIAKRYEADDGYSTRRNLVQAVESTVSIEIEYSDTVSLSC